jgi:hypothetical protein
MTTGLTMSEVNCALQIIRLMNDKICRLYGEEDPDHTGGYVFLTDDNERPADGYIVPCAVSAIGNVPRDKAARYYRNATEKATRLILQHRRGESKLWETSWQSRNPDQMQYGGGVRFVLPDDRIVVMSFSGYPEHRDEAIVIATGVHMQWIRETPARLIANDLTLHCLEQLLDRGL